MHVTNTRAVNNTLASFGKEHAAELRWGAPLACPFERNLIAFCIARNTGARIYIPQPRRDSWLRFVFLSARAKARSSLLPTNPAKSGRSPARTSRVGLAGSPSHKSRRQLTPQQLATLRETVRRDLIEGPISKKCKDEDQAAKDRGEPPIDRPFNDRQCVLSTRCRLS